MEEQSKTLREGVEIQDYTNNFFCEFKVDTYYLILPKEKEQMKKFFSMCSILEKCFFEGFRRQVISWQVCSVSLSLFP